MTESDSILLVDDHPLFRGGLKTLLHSAYPDAEIREAGSLEETRAELLVRKPSVVVLDVTLPDGEGMTIAGEILGKFPECRIYILTMHSRSGLLIQARDAGCRGYFLKDGDGSAIIEALESDKKDFLVSDQLRDLLEYTESGSDTAKLYGELTRREKEVFRLFADGLGYKEVAWKLGISPRTASVHRYNIFNKLKINSDVDLVKAAREVGLSI